MNRTLVLLLLLTELACWLSLRHLSVIHASRESISLVGMTHLTKQYMTTWSTRHIKRHFQCYILSSKTKGVIKVGVVHT